MFREKESSHAMKAREEKIRNFFHLPSSTNYFMEWSKLFGLAPSEQSKTIESADKFFTALSQGKIPDSKAQQQLINYLNKMSKQTLAVFIKMLQNQLDFIKKLNKSQKGVGVEAFNKLFTNFLKVQTKKKQK